MPMCAVGMHWPFVYGNGGIRQSGLRRPSVGGYRGASMRSGAVMALARILADTRCRTGFASRPEESEGRSRNMEVVIERITSYSVSVQQTNYMNTTRSIGLKLESGTSVYIEFPEVRPDDWLRFSAGIVFISMTADQYDDVYHILQTEDPAFCTAVDAGGEQFGGLHTELDLSIGEPTGEGYQDQSLEAMIVRAQKRAADTKGT